KPSGISARRSAATRSHQVQPPFHHPRAVTVVAQPANDECVAARLEGAFLADLANDRLQRRVLELDHLVALGAVEMLVLRVAVVMLEVSLGPELDTAKQAGVHQLAQRAIDGGPADVQLLALQLVDELIGVEMTVPAEDVTDHVALLTGKTLGARPARQ